MEGSYVKNPNRGGRGGFHGSCPSPLLSTLYFSQLTFPVVSISLMSLSEINGYFTLHAVFFLCVVELKTMFLLVPAPDSFWTSYLGKRTIYSIIEH